MKQSHKKRTLNRIFLSVLLTGVVAIGAFLGLRSTSRAVINETNAITFAQAESKLGEIPVCFIFTGTHLMHIDGVTDNLYEKAVETGKESGQTKIYYRSEIADGSWFEVEGTGIDEIYKKGRPVGKTVINPLYVRYYTGADGVTKDILTMIDIGPFDMPDPYDLYNLPELDPLRKAYDGIISDEAAAGDASASFMKDKIKAFFGLNVRSEETDLCDGYLNKLQPLYDSYKDAGDDDKADTVYGLMERVDARRRYLVFMKLLEREDEGYQMSLDIPYKEDAKNLDALYNQLTGLSYTGQGKYNRMDEAETSCESARSNCDASRAKNAAKMFREGTDVRTRGLHRADLNVLDKLDDPSVTELMAIEHLINDDILDKALELLSLDERSGSLNNKTVGFIEEATVLMVDELKAGAGSEYVTADKNGESPASLQGRLKARKDERLTPAVEETQALIILRKERIELEEALAYVQDRYDTAVKWEVLIKADAYENLAMGALKDHEQWLLDLIAQIQAEIDSQNANVDNLNDQMDGLIDGRNNALNEDNQKDVKKYDAMIGALDDIIEREKKKGGSGSDDQGSDGTGKGGTGNDGTGTGGTDGTSGGTGGTGDGTGNDGASGAGDGSSGAGDGSGGTGGTGDGSADGAGDGTGGATDGGSGEGDGTAGSGDGSGDGSGKAKGKKSGYLSDEDIMNILASVLGGPFDSLDAKGKIIAAVGTGEFADRYQPARQMSVNFMNICIRENNPYAFSQIKDKSTTQKYSSVTALATASGYRYEYTDRKHTLSKYSRYFSFKPGSDTYEGEEGEAAFLTAVREWSYKGNNIPYIGEGDVKASFQCLVKYVKETNYGACFSQQMEIKKTKLVNALNEALNNSKTN